MGKRVFQRRTPSGYRNLLEVRVRRIAGSKPESVRLRAFYEIRELANEAIEQMESEGARLDDE